MQIKESSESSEHQLSLSTLNSFLTNIHIVCHKQNKAESICFNSKCEQNIFLCAQNGCDCKKLHTKCPKVLIESLKQFVSSKLVSLKDLQNELIEKIDKAIDSLSEMREKISMKFDQEYENFGLSKDDELLLEALKTGRREKLKGINILNIFYEVDEQKERSEIKKNKVQSMINTLWLDMDNFIATRTSSTLEILEELDKDRSILTIQKIYEPLFTDSVILKGEMQHRMIEFFSNKKPISAKLLFRASQNQFSKDKFHEICDQISQTLTICVTEFGKIIGGYTPLVWMNPQQYQYVNDKTGNSFIFSLSNNHKFTLIKDKPAICRANHIGPTFGELNPDFYIADKCNVQTSCALINNCYYNQNYVHDPAESRKKFSGTSLQRFKIKEWEVWELQFFEDKKIPSLTRKT